MPFDNTARKNYALRGKLAYETDVALNPVYHDGTPRPGWNDLDEVKKESWRRPRRKDSQPTTELTPEGEQYVIPGAEKKTAPGSEDEQGELW